MYTYSGTGYCLPLGSRQADELANAYGVEDIYEVDDAMELGDWCSGDNVESAYFDGRGFDVTAGVLVLRDGYGNPQLLARLCGEIGIDAGEHHGTFEINCWD